MSKKSRKSIVKYIAAQAYGHRKEAERLRAAYSVDETNARDFDNLADDLEELAEQIRLREDEL